MGKTAQLQTNFTAGEIDPALLLRRDTKQYSAGAKSLLNSRILIGGGSKRRPGTRRQAKLVGFSRIEDYVVNQSTQYVLAFNNGAMQAFLRDTLNGTLLAAGSLTGCPWTGETWLTMDFLSFGNTLIFTHPTFIHMVKRLTSTTWSQQSFPWATAVNGRIRQPQAKIAPFNIKIQPSALTGAITLTLTEPWWQAGHVGARVRILDREVTITSIVSPTVANATVIDPLRETQEINVANSANFAVGDIILGENSGARAIITSIADSTHMRATLIKTTFAVETSTTVGAKQGTTGITTTIGFESGELIIGPEATTTSTAVSIQDPGAVPLWTEQLYSSLWGYPRAIVAHRSRLIFGGSTGAPSTIAGSSLVDVFDFDVRDASDAEGFVETIGDAIAVEIIQMVSAEQLLILTDKGPYYVPESTANPFRPTALAFNRFGDPWPCSTARAGAFDSGVIMVSGSTVVKLAPTGNTTAVWEAKEKSLLSPHLFKTPVETCYVTNYAGGSERYAIFVNGDGTVTVMQLHEAEAVRNCVKWVTNRRFMSICAILGDLYTVAEHTINGVFEYWLEMFDEAATLDGITSYADEAALANVPATYGDATVHVIAGTRMYLGTYPPTVDPLPPGPYQVGFFYSRIIELLPPVLQDGDGDHSGQLMRYTYIDINVLESCRFVVNGGDLEAYLIGEDTNLAPPLRTGWQRVALLGWSREPTRTIIQPDPLPLTVLGVRSEVAYQ